MSKIYGYIRVSTVKQGIQGVSLQEQRSAIERYAQINNLSIINWFEETQTAAKRGRPVFTRMLKLLKQGKAEGVAMHKIDRSARNLKDWADLGELIDSGVSVYIASENLDLHSRGGRLTADIQAVIAADYIRNLRDETKKGMYGRLKQGLYPFAAPIGYLNTGKGKPKIIDPERAPLIKTAFTKYATGKFTLESLCNELKKLGLRNQAGGSVTRNGLSIILNNSFYIGLIRIRTTGETFTGVHKTIISKKLYDQVQDVLSGKVYERRKKHEHLFRRFLVCVTCSRALIGELQKGNVYYRCHSKECRKTILREDIIQSGVLRIINLIELTDEEMSELEVKIEQLRRNWEQEKQDVINNLGLRKQGIEARMDRLTDAYLDKVVEKSVFDRRKENLLLEMKDVEGSLHDYVSGKTSIPDNMQKIIELIKTLKNSYTLGNKEKKRELLRLITSNFSVHRKKLDVKLRSPYLEMANRRLVTGGDPSRDEPRTFSANDSSSNELFTTLHEHFTAENENNRKHRQNI